MWRSVLAGRHADRVGDAVPPDAPVRRRLLTGGISNCLGKITTVATWFVLTPFILGELGPEAYALWVLTTAVASYGFLLDLGIGGTVVKYVAEYTARDDRESAESLVSSAAWLYIALALMTLVIGGVIAPVIPPFVGVGEADQALATTVILLAVVNVAATIAFTTPFAVLRGLQRYDVDNALIIVNSLAEGAVVVVAVGAGWGVAGMVFALVPVTVATGLACVFVVRRLAPGLRMWTGPVRPRILRRIGSFSSSLFAISVAGRLQTRTDEFIIAALDTLSAATPYALARRLGELSHLVSVQLLKVVMPLASALDARDEAAKLRTLYIVASRVALGVAVPITVVLLVLGSDLLDLWVGPEYAPYAPVLWVLAIASLVGISQWPAVEILQGINRHRIVAGAALTAGAANVIFSILLLPVFGLIGVAFGTLIPSVAVWLGLVMPVTNKILSVPTAAMLRNAWAPGLIPAAGAAAVLWLLDRAGMTASIAGAAASSLISAAVYAIGYLAMKPAAPERQLVADLIAGGSSRIKQFARPTAAE